MSEPVEYELSMATLKDIIEKVPPEKWDAVLSELSVALKEVKSVRDLLNSTGQALGVGDVVSLPETITWVDDGKSDNKYHVTDREDKEVMATFNFNSESEL